MRTPLQCMALCLALATLTAGCGCTEEGCIEATVLTFTRAGAPLTAFGFHVTATAHTFEGFCGVPQQPDSSECRPTGGIELPLTSGALTVTVQYGVGLAEQVTRTVTPANEIHFPNGERCDSGCMRGRAVVAVP